MILWPLLYLACEANLRKDFRKSGDHAFFARLFPFDLLWGNDKNPMIYDRSKLTVLIKTALLDKFLQSSPDRAAFETMCHVLGFMCAHDPKERKIDTQSPLSATEQCFNYLCTGNVQSDAAAAACASFSTVDPTFDPVCNFIDNFCASGHHRGGRIKVSQKTDRWRRIVFSRQPQHVEYERVSEEQSWLFLKRNAVPHAQFPLTYEDCMTPDYYVVMHLPLTSTQILCIKRRVKQVPSQQHVHGTSQPRAIFLPRNRFCFGPTGDIAGMFDVSRMTLLTQRDWFTVFRYERPGQSPWIIK